MNNNVCVHGNLKRQCQICDQIAEIEELHARVAKLEKQLEERKSTNVGWRHYEAEPVAWRYFDGGRHYYFDQYVTDCIYELKPLYTQPPSTQAAVAAALRVAAELCRSLDVEDNSDQYRKGAMWARERILALPHDDSHLREVCMRVAKKVHNWNGLDTSDLQDIVDRVLGEAK